jgi:hypothetical protein
MKIEVRRLSDEELEDLAEAAELAAEKRSRVGWIRKLIQFVDHERGLEVEES